MHDPFLWRQLNGTAQLRNCGVQIVQVEQSLAQGTMSARKLRINRNRLPECRRRRLQLPFLYERHSQIVCSFEIGGIQLQSPLQRRDGGIHLPSAGLRHTEIKKSESVVRTKLNSFLQLVDRVFKHVQPVIIQALEIVGWN